jgi:hypothetical protein
VAGKLRKAAKVSQAAKLCGFFLLLAVMFAASYAVGARLGPVTVSHVNQGPGGSMHMGGMGRSDQAPITGSQR